VVFSHDSTWLASASEDGIVKVWDARSGEYVSTLRDYNNSVVVLTFSYSKLQLASASRGQIVKVWDASSGERVSTLRGHSTSVTSVAFSYDSNRLASASWGGSVKVWNASSGKCLLTFGHYECVTSVAFSRDSTWLASASYDSTVKIWDASSGECLSTLGVKQTLYSISFGIGKTHLLTDIGVINIHALSNSRPALTNPEPQSSQYQGLALSAGGVWITHNLKNLVWLPSEYRPSCSVVSGNMIGIGTGSGRVWICEVQCSRP
jgi:WD40 repeat protein